MKFYRITDEANTWWVEYRTSGMENSKFEKVTNILTSHTNKLDLSPTMLGLGLPNHLGQEITQLGLETLVTNNSLRLEKRYESKAPEWLRKSSAALISMFKFLDSTNAALSADVTGVIDDEGGTIAVTVPNGTTVTALVASFTSSYGVASVKISTTSQVSGVTANDFTNPKTYVVTAEDGTTKNYVVTVTVSA